MHRKILLAVVSVALPTLLLAQAPNPPAKPETEFHPPEPLVTTDIAYPIRSVAYGTVVLEAAVGETGEVTRVRVVRDIVSLTSEAVRAVKAWKFQPAKLNGNPVPSQVTVAVTFNPRTFFPSDVPLPPLTPTKEEGAKPRYVPPGVVSASFPAFPVIAVSPGTVALGVLVDEKGEVEQVKVLKDTPPLTEEAIKALKRWKFTPARFDETPVRATIVVAIVFTLPPVYYYR